MTRHYWRTRSAWREQLKMLLNELLLAALAGPGVMVSGLEWLERWQVTPRALLWLAVLNVVLSLLNLSSLLLFWFAVLWASK